jgi:hypothetical protein
MVVEKVGNGQVNKILLALCSLLLGMVLTGAFAVARGDYLGREAAEEVENRIKEDLSEIKTDIREIRRLYEQQYKK